MKDTKTTENAAQRLRRVIGRRPVALLVHGPSAATLEQRISEFTYHPNGLLESRTEKGATAEVDDATTSYQYDAFGSLPRITDPEGYERRFEDHDALAADTPAQSITYDY